MHEHKISRRRDFLKSAAGAATAFAVPSFIPAAALGRDARAAERANRDGCDRHRRPRLL